MHTKQKALMIKDTIKFLPTVIRSGYFSPWTRSIFDRLLMKKNTLDKHTPWVPYEVHRWLRSYLKPYMRVFEYGAGGSTIFFAEQVKEVVSVEHNRSWNNAIKTELLRLGLENVTILVYEPELDIVEKPDCTDPGAYRSRLNPDYSFKKYVQSILTYPDGYFDLISIDGAARPSCILTSMDKVKPNGYIMFDDSDRSIYRKGFALLEAWKKQVFRGPKPTDIHSNQTTVWQKPP